MVLTNHYPIYLLVFLLAHIFLLNCYTWDLMISESYYVDRLKRACLDTFGTTSAETRWARKGKLIGSFLSQHFVRTLKYGSTYPAVTFFRVAPSVINHSYRIWHRSTLFLHAFKPAINIFSHVGIIGISSIYILLLERILIPITIFH